MNNTERNPCNFHGIDTLNLVDMALLTHDELGEDMDMGVPWWPNSYIRLWYNYQEQTFTTSIRSRVIVALTELFRLQPLLRNFITADYGNATNSDEVPFRVGIFLNTTMTSGRLTILILE